MSTGAPVKHAAGHHVAFGDPRLTYLHVMLTARAVLMHFATSDMISDLDRDRVFRSLPRARIQMSSSSIWPTQVHETVTRRTKTKTVLPSMLARGGISLKSSWRRRLSLRKITSADNDFDPKGRPRRGPFQRLAMTSSYKSSRRDRTIFSSVSGPEKTRSC
jgi:hypothetical protein